MGEERTPTLLLGIFFFFAFFCSFSSAGLRSRGQGGRRDNDGRTGLGKEQKIEGGGKPGFP